MAFLFSACGGKREDTFRSLINEQKIAYSDLAQVLDRIAADGASPASDEKLLKLGREIKGLKDKLLQIEQPTQEEMTAFTSTEESGDYLDRVHEVNKKYLEIKTSGKGSEALDRAFEEIVNSH